MGDELQVPGWLSPHLASASEATPIPMEPFWRVQVEYTWVEPGGSGTGRMFMPEFGSLPAAHASLARLRANPLEALANAMHSGRVYTPTRWRLLRFEAWSLVFDEEVGA